MEALLTTKEAARVLGVSESFLERDRWAGARIPFVRVGLRAVRYSPKAIADYLNVQTRRSTIVATSRTPSPASRPR
jgi:excisionase family DNA binding protein